MATSLRLPVYPQVFPVTDRVARSPDELVARVHSVNPRLDSESTVFQGAVLLLAGLTEHNIDKLARITGYRREFVARVARRLYDNGVWMGNETVGAWNADIDCEVAFWADAGVAGGTLCRRVDEHGYLQWAPPGYWHKHYEYVSGPGRTELGVAYSTVSDIESGAECRNGLEADNTRGSSDPSTALPLITDVSDHLGEPNLMRETRARSSWERILPPIRLGGSFRAPPLAGSPTDAVWIG